MPTRHAFAFFFLLLGVFSFAPRAHALETVLFDPTVSVNQGGFFTHDSDGSPSRPGYGFLYQPSADRDANLIRVGQCKSGSDLSQYAGETFKVQIYASDGSGTKGSLLYDGDEKLIDTDLLPGIDSGTPYPTNPTSCIVADGDPTYNSYYAIPEGFTFEAGEYYLVMVRYLGTVDSPSSTYLQMFANIGTTIPGGEYLGGYYYNPDDSISTAGSNKWLIQIWNDDAIVPPAPPTEFNEVIDYIYDPVLDNSVGTSTVGARFSIPQPDWVSSIGFDIRGPLGNVLYTGSTTPSSPDVYDVSTDYYFGSAGAYELVAWFISDTGQKIVNPVTVFIVVNAEPWVFDPVTGDLVPVSSTTIATSTLTNFKVDCPDDVLVGSLCKLAVGLFIPKTSSIQGLQASFYGVMGKAPFSFFTQSKTILDAFRVGTASSGGALTLSLYGNSVQVVSSSTASQIGVDSGMIDFLKGIMIVGLWLMLAWYLYWRIASIFGV